MKEGTIGDVTAIEEPDVRANGAAPGRLRALFFMRSSDRDPGFGGLVSAMLERDHEVVVAFEHKGRLAPAERRALDDLSKRYPGFDQVRLEPRRDLWRIPAGAIRRSLDYLRCLEPEHGHSDELRDQARDRAPRLLRALLFLPPFRWRFGRRMLGWLLQRLEAGMPIPRRTKALIREGAPDVVVVSPLVEFASPHAEYIRSAQAARIPSALVVMSWGDLPDTVVIRDVPTLTVVANQDEVNEAVRVFGLPRDRIEAVGAEGSNGAGVPAPSDAVDAIDRAALTEDVPRPPGRFLRPLLWLLTPLLAIVLPLLRPRATLQAARKGVRRIRKRFRAGRASGTEKRAENRKAAREEKQARKEAAKQRKAARAAEKQRKRARREAVAGGGEGRAKGKGKGKGKTAPAEPGEEPAEAEQ
jgi:hypothetical protein